MHTRRFGGLTGATAQRLLDGGDGPPPLPQLVAAVTAPATAAELRGEAAARAAFRSSTHAAPLSPDIPRRAPVRVTSSVIIAKVIAAITLTASTAGGIALATTSAPADPHARAISETTASGDAAPSLVIASPTSTGAFGDPENLDGSDGTAGALAAEAPDAAGSADGHPHNAVAVAVAVAEGSAPDRPVQRTDEPLRGGPGRQGHQEPRLHRPQLQRGRYRRRTHPADRPPRRRPRQVRQRGQRQRQRQRQGQGKGERTEKAGKNEDASDAQAGRDVGGNADRGKSGEHRQND